MRLVVDPFSGDDTDDRHLARYVAHIAADRKEPDCRTQLWAIGMSRYKRITNDWTPFNCFMGPHSREEFDSLNIPFTSEP